ncbi:MAG: histidine--tRNA ligase [Clostridiales Family XIII bacterium]|jgi:histidyl-tRNA synthetase|nr:histidine--tRNA ligase [Clostridiales Family XIII bacterium]
MLSKAPRGTKDILPDQIYKWHYVEKVFSELCRVCGFDEARTPVFEHTELFRRGVGDATDIVEKQMYTFEDYAGRSLTLRPEGTSPMARAFAEHRLYAEGRPAKYCYEIPCFRYEKPQSGRLREFHQFGVEIFGSADMAADAEVIGFAAAFFEKLGVPGVDLRINSIGCPACRAEYREKLRDFLRPAYDGLCDVCKSRFEHNPLRILDCKSEICRGLIEGAPSILDHLCEECAAAFASLKKNLEWMEVAYTVDPGIVRGLDYYTKTAFEFVYGSIGAKDTLCGGGRYDGLIAEIGGPSVPGVGFGLGIERLLLAMDACGAEIPKPAPADVFIAALGESAKPAAVKLTRDLRGRGLRAQMDEMARNLKGQFKYADRLGARYTAVIGEDELRENRVTLRDMLSGEQRPVALDRVAAEILQRH